MIAKHVDIWAVLLLLLAFAVFTKTSDGLMRGARARLYLIHRVQPVEVHVGPFQLNQFNRLEKRHIVPPCGII